MEMVTDFAAGHKATGGTSDYVQNIKREFDRPPLVPPASGVVVRGDIGSTFLFYQQLVVYKANG